jgi:hypothetical protein
MAKWVILPDCCGVKISDTMGESVIPDASDKYTSILWTYPSAEVYRGLLFALVSAGFEYLSNKQVSD